MDVRKPWDEPHGCNALSRRITLRYKLKLVQITEAEPQHIRIEPALANRLYRRDDTRSCDTDEGRKVLD